MKTCDSRSSYVLTKRGISHRTIKEAKCPEQIWDVADNGTVTAGDIDSIGEAHGEGIQPSVKTINCAILQCGDRFRVQFQHESEFSSPVERSVDFAQAQNWAYGRDGIRVN